MVEKYGLIGSILYSLVLITSCFGMQASQAAQPDVLPYYLDQPEISRSQLTKTDESELTYQLILAEIAGYRGELSVSLENMLAVAQRVDDPRVAERATRVGVYAQDVKNSLAAARRWIELDPENQDAHQFAAVLSFRNGEQDVALTHLKKILELKERGAGEGFAIITGLFSHQKDQQEALALMALLVTEYKDNPYALMSYGSLAMQAKRYESAKHLLNSAITLKPDLVAAIVMRANVQRELGELDAAISGITVALKKHPNDKELRLTNARLLISAKRYAAARDEFKALLDVISNDTHIIYSLGLLTLELKQYDESQQYFEYLLDIGNRVDDANYYLAQIAERQREYEEAIGYYFKIIEGQYLFDSRIRIAALYAKLGRTERARDDLKRMRINSTQPAFVVRLYLAEHDILVTAKQYQQALDLLDESLQRFTENSDLLYARAMTAERIDRLDILEKDLRRILEKDPQNADALNALGYTLADRGQRLDEAYELINQALQLKPDNPAIIDSMGWVLYRLGRHEEAVGYLQRALKLQTDPEIAGHLGEVLWVSGATEEARKVWNRALQETPDHEKLINTIKRFQQ